MSADLDQPLNATDRRIWRWWQQEVPIDRMVRKLGLPARPGLDRIKLALDRMPEGWEPPREEPEHPLRVQAWLDHLLSWLPGTVDK